MQKKNEKEGKDRLILALVILYICAPAFVGLLTYSIKSLTELGKTQGTQNSRTYKRKSRNKCNLYHRANGRIVLPTNTVFNCVRSSGCPYGCYEHYNQIGYNYASPQECKRAQISCINRICGHLCE